MDGFTRFRGCYYSQTVSIAPDGKGWTATTLFGRDSVWHRSASGSDAMNAMRRLEASPTVELPELPAGMQVDPARLKAELERRGISIVAAWAMLGRSPKNNSYLYEILNPPDGRPRKVAALLQRRMAHVFGRDVLVSP